LLPEDAFADAARRVGQEGLKREAIAAKNAAVAFKGGPRDEVEPVSVPAEVPFIGDNATEGAADPAESGDDEVDGLQEILPKNPPGPAISCRDASIFI
jgi:hypothetical protein